jgi:hypothetical protein
MLLLALDLMDATIVQDALNLYAARADDDGDELGAKAADAITDRVRALNTITAPAFAEWVRFAGCGPAGDHHQG